MKLIFVLNALLCSLAFAAPIPATSTSELIGADIGRYFSSKGFSIDNKNTEWKQTVPPKNNPFIETLYIAPYKNLGVQASLTVRVDSLKKKTTPQKYIKKWIKDYPRLGFKVLAAKKVKVRNKKGFLLDIVNKSNNRQIRQVFFAKNKKVVLLTCRDHKETFNTTLKDCNKIIRNFKWTN